MDIPLVDLDADAGDIVPAVDRALRTIGFLLVRGHGIDPTLPAAVRAAATDFFHLDAAHKVPYTTTVGQPGWIPPGVEANGYVLGLETPPDLKEVWMVAREGAEIMGPAGPIVAANPPVAEVPALVPAALAYLDAADRAARRVLALLAAALGDAGDVVAGATDRAASTLSLTWYPALRRVGEPAPGQFRVGPHTDFGTVTLLDRQPGLGGLQVQGPDGTWVDAPHEPGALVVNIGDLMARWTGDRWRSTLHRVLPPQPEAPAEELLSLVYFVEANLDAVIAPLPPPVGGPTAYEPVVAGDHLRRQLQAITV